MKKTIYSIWGIISITLLFLNISSCVKEDYSVPTFNTVPDKDTMTIAEIEALNVSTGPLKFVDSTVLICTVTADEHSGNLYKQVFVEDNTGGITLFLKATGGLYQGDKIKVQLNGCYVKEYKKMMQIDSVDVDVNITKLSVLNPVTPDTLTIAQIKASPVVVGQFVYIDKVEFTQLDAGKKWADKANLVDKSLYIQDSLGNSLIVRTSAYSNFADLTSPTGRGYIMGIISRYDNDIQLVLRDVSEMKMDGARKTPLPFFTKDFNDNSVYTGGWTQVNVKGPNQIWLIDATHGVGGTPCAVLGGYVGGTYYENEDWLISPAINTADLTSVKLSFITAANYTGNTLEVKVSTDYIDSNFATATWTALTPALSSGGWTQVNSGEIDLSAYKNANMRIAFKYTSTTSSSKTWQIDNIMMY